MSSSNVCVQQANRRIEPYNDETIPTAWYHYVQRANYCIETHKGDPIPTAWFNRPVVSESEEEPHTFQAATTEPHRGTTECYQNWEHSMRNATNELFQ
jgi:hypothetical protein